MSRRLLARFDGAAGDHAAGRATETSFRLQVAAVRECLPAGGERILDLGCGSGALAECPGMSDATIVGFDLSEGMLREAFARGRVVARSDAGRLPLGDASFDVVVALGLLEYVPDVGAVLREITRVLRPGGSAVLTWPNSRAPARLWMRLFPGRFDQDLARRLTVRDVAAVAETTGLTVTRVRTTNAALLPWPLDALFPGLARALSRACDPLTRSRPFSLLGTQCVVAARRDRPDRPGRSG